MGDGWQHKDDIPDDPNAWGRQTVRRRSYMGVAAGEGNYEARKYKVNVQERNHGFQVVYIENGTSRAGAFRVDRHGQHTWLDKDEQRILVNSLRRNSFTEARAGSQYSMAKGMIDNALTFHPGQGIQLGVVPPGPPIGYENEIETYADETAVRERELEGTTNMSNSREAIALMQLHNGARLYGVKFMAEGFVKPDQKTYTYKDVSGLELAVMDLVVVEARESFAIAQIVQLNVSPSSSTVELGKVRHIVSKIDQVAHGAKLAKEHEAIERLAMAEVGERLEKFRQQLGASNFESVRSLLGGPVVEQHSTDATVMVSRTGHLFDIQTGEVFGKINGYGVGGWKGYIKDGRFYPAGSTAQMGSHLIYPDTVDVAQD